MKKKETILAGVLFLFFSYLHFYGINWGIPDKKISFLIFENEKIIDKLASAMLSTHSEIREMQEYYGAPYKPTYKPDEIIILNINGKKGISKEIINSCRSYFTRSSGADEQAVLSALSKMSPSRFDFNPHFYEYGGVYLYPMGALFYILSKIHLLTIIPDISYYFFNPDAMGRIYTAGRIFGGIGAFLSIIVFLLLCTELFQNKKLIYLLTFFYGSSAGFAVWSHYLKPFSYGMLWFLITLYMLIKFYKSEKIKWLYIASAFAGLSFGTLLSYGYIYWAVILFIIFLKRDPVWKIKTLFFTFIIFLGVFFITNPYVLISYNEFLQELKYLRTYWQKDISINALSTFIFNSMRYGLGTLLWITLVVCFLGSVFYKPDKLSLLLLLIILPAFFYFSFTTGNWIHYSIFLYPLFIISAGLFLSRIKFNKFILCVLLIVGLFTALYTISYVKLFGMENTRIEAGMWINHNIPHHTRIGLFEAPSPWRTPPFRFLDYNIIITDEKIKIEKEKPEYFIVSEYQWLRGADMETVKKILSDYEILKKFETEPSILGIKFKHPEKIPYDWCHPNPVILIWKRKD